MSSAHGLDSKTNRFFHAMVLMGGSLALGCGGVAEKPGEVTDSTGTGGTGGNTGTGASGGSLGTGGSAVGSGGAVVGSGGTAIGSGGGITIGGGGTGGLIEPGPFACPPAQWECEAPECYGYGYALPESCPCNPERPASPADCQEGEWLVCRDATQNVEGQTFTRSVPFNCQCLPAEASCQPACDKLGAAGDCWAPSENDPTILCGCAVVILR